MDTTRGQYLSEEKKKEDVQGASTLPELAGLWRAGRRHSPLPRDVAAREGRVLRKASLKIK